MRGARRADGPPSYPQVVARGRKAVAWLNLVAAAAVSAHLTRSLWQADSGAAYIGLSFGPAIAATGLAVIIGPRLWGRMAPADGRFDLLRGGIAGAMTVLLVHLITIEIVLLAGSVMMAITGEAEMYLQEVPWLVLAAPVLSIYRFGALTLPAGIAVGAGVAVWCQRQLA